MNRSARIFFALLTASSVSVALTSSVAFAQAPEAASESPSPAKPQTESPAKPESPPKPEQGPWQRLSASLAAARKTRRAALEKKLEPYRPDLVLRYEDNAKYLDEKYSAIRELDPEIADVLVPLLFPEKADKVSVQIAENALRVLRPMPLDAWLPTLLAKAQKAHLHQRLRALDLLSSHATPELRAKIVAIFDELLPTTPERQLPRLLAVIGQSEARELAPKLLSFLDRPSAEQRIAALSALAALRYAPALAKLTETATALNEQPAWGALLGALQSMHPQKAPEGLRAAAPDYGAALAAILSNPPRMSRVQLLAALELVRELPSSAYREGRGPILEALRPLLEHPFPKVNHEAARSLQHLGDEDGIKTVLDRLDASVKKNRRVPFVYLQRARAYEAFDMIREALKDVKDAIRYSGKGRVTPDLHFFAARLECRRGNASQVYQHLRDADPTPKELERFREEMRDFGLEALLERHRGLGRLFEQD